MSVKTVEDLKQYLQDIIDDLEANYDDEQKVHFYQNTYWCSPNFLSIAGRGFIDFDNPVDDDDDDESDETEDSEE